ncbi:MFS transporter [Bacillus kwashiorkori]|uniref:MFS transporter n=1 Tax=Bacillus kwashiorkori TaxID=1522318 RepID=UPI0008F83623|nr:MFS transporter [Bacillus kwashiorkori]
MKKQTFIQKWFGEVEVTKDLFLLLFIGGLYSLSVALSNTFVNIFLWRQSGEFYKIGLYNLAIVIFQLITFIIAGRIAKKVDRIIVLRLGVCFLAIFYIAVLISSSKASSLLLLLGSLLGVGYGFYWLSYNVLTFEITEPENRDFFNGFLGILSSAGGMIGPMAAGYIISRFTSWTGYTIIFTISLLLFTCATVLSFSMKRRPSKGVYLFREVMKERKRNRDWFMITNANIFQGLREGVFSFIINIYVFIATGSEMALGTFAFLNSFVSFISYYVAGRYIKPKHRKKSILLGGALLFLSLSLIIFQITYTKLLIYAVLIAISYPLVLVPFSSTSYDVIGKARNAAEMRIEYIVVRELFLNFGRAVSILLFIISITFFQMEFILPYLLFILGSSYLFIYYCIRKISDIYPGSAGEKKQQLLSTKAKMRPQKTY